MSIRAALAAATLICFAAPAVAADYWAEKPFELRAGKHDWTGGYAGVHAGHGWGDHSLSIFGIPFGSDDTKGLVAGVQAGYRSQNDGFVWGIETDLSYFDHGVRYQDFPFDFTADMNWVGSARLVAGVPLDNVLLYATGGLAASRLTMNEPLLGIDHKKFLWGWTAGVGAEFALSPSWSARGEYLYYDFGKTDQRLHTLFPIPIPITTEHSFHIVRAGLNYRFD